MLVHIVVSCDDNPFLDPGLRVASLHSLQNVEKWMNDKKSNQIVFIIFVSPSFLNWKLIAVFLYQLYRNIKSNPYCFTLSNS